MHTFEGAYGVAVSIDGDGFLDRMREHGRLTLLLQSCDSSSAGMTLSEA